MQLPLRVRLLVWFLAGALLSPSLWAADTDDTELCPIYSRLVAIAENGRLTHTLRAIDVQILRYPGDARLPALRSRIVQQTASLNTVPFPLPPSRPPLPVIAHDRPDAGQNFTSHTAAIPLLWIAPGSFRLTNPQSSDDDTRVTLSRGYWLGRTEVTQTQWRTVMQNLPSPSFFDGSDRPVENISWVNAVEFCQKLTARESARGLVPEGYAYALPTEAQWEFACRAGTTGPHPGVLADLGWFEANSDHQTHPVGQKAPNPWGLHDMAGNVAEWCADGYSGYPGGEVVDRFNAETGEAAAMYKVLRGGDFTSTLGQCRSGFRTRRLLTFASAGVGFRVALAPIRPAPAVVSP